MNATSDSNVSNLLLWATQRLSDSGALFRIVFLLIGLCLLVAATAPILGLGTYEQFILYEPFGLSRRALAEYTLVASGAVGALYYWHLTTLRTAPGAFDQLITTIGSVALSPAYHRNWVVVLVLLPVAIFSMVFLLTTQPSNALIAPDSKSYINFHTERTLFYPVIFRVAAIFASSAYQIVLGQLVLGLAAMLFFAEVLQRIFRSYALSLSVGFVLLTNWPLINLSQYVLTDYPFFISFLLFAATSFLIVLNPRKSTMVVLAVIIVVAIGVRPAATFMLTGPLGLLILMHGYRLRLLKFLVAPLFCLLMLYCSLNQMVYGYFGLSKFTGWSVMPNAAWGMLDEIPHEKPELMKRMIALAKPFQEGLAEQDTIHDRMTYLVQNTNPVLGRQRRLVGQWAQENPDDVELSDVSLSYEIWQWFSDKSELNRQFAKIGSGQSPSVVWSDNTATSLAFAAFAANPSELARIMAEKLYVAPSYLMRFHQTPNPFTETKRGRRVLDVSDDMLGFTSDMDFPKISEFGETMIKAHRVLIIYSFLISNRSPAQWLVMTFCVVGAIIFLTALFSKRAIPVEWKVLALASAYLAGYVVMVNFAHIMLTRYSLVMLPMVLLLFFAFLVAFRTVAESAKRANRGDMGADL